MKPRGPIPHSQELSNNAYLVLNQSNAYFFLIHLNTIFSSTSRFSKRSPYSRSNLNSNPWFMELRGSIPHSQGVFNNPYFEPDQSNIYFFISHSNIILSSTLKLSERPPFCRYNFNSSPKFMNRRFISAFTRVLQ